MESKTLHDLELDNRESLTILIQSLDEVIKLAIDENLPKPDFRICRNWATVLDDASYNRLGYAHIVPPSRTYLVVGLLAPQWPLFNPSLGSDEDLPIPGDRYMTEEDQFWQGEFLELRLDLMRFMREALHTHLKEL